MAVRVDLAEYVEDDAGLVGHRGLRLLTSPDGSVSACAGFDGQGVRLGRERRASTPVRLCDQSGPAICAVIQIRNSGVRVLYAMQARHRKSDDGAYREMRVMAWAVTAVRESKDIGVCWTAQALLLQIRTAAPPVCHVRISNRRRCAPSTETS